MATKAGKGAAVFISTLPSVSLTIPEPTTSSDLTNYQINATGHRYLDRDATTSLEFSTNGGASWNPVVNSGASAYTIQWVGGWVRFGVAQGAGTLIRFSAGKYFAMSALGQAMQWDLNIESDLVDTTVFGAAAKVFTPTIRGHSGSLKEFWADQSMFTIGLQQLLVLQFYVDSVAGTRYEGFGRIKTNGVTVSESGLFMEDVQFQIDGDIYQV